MDDKLCKRGHAQSQVTPLKFWNALYGFETGRCIKIWYKELANGQQ